MSMTTTRPLSLHERYAVARRTINSPSIVTAAALLQLSSNQDSSQAFEALQTHLSQRIDQVLDSYPLLGHCIQSPRSKTPSWRPITPAPTAQDILRIGPKLPAYEEDKSKLLAKAILDEQLNLPQSTDLETGPLWRVTLHPLSSSSECLVVLATDHSINDGRGTLNLFQLLLSPLPTLPSSAVIPPPSDKVFNFKPSTSYMLGVVWEELILPKLPLPSKLKSKLRGAVSWPAASTSTKRKREEKVLVKQPKESPPALDILLITTPRLITNLKTLAQRHVNMKSKTKKAATLHAIIHTLALAALYSAITHSIPSSSTTGGSKIVLGTGTPISLREEAPHPDKRRKTLPSLDPLVNPSSPSLLPLTSGNYVSSHVSRISLSPSSTFWTITNDFASTLATPKSRKLAKAHMGMLAYIPDFDRSLSPTDSDSEKGGKKECLNGWEQFFHQKATCPTPFDSAFTISNLGFIKLNQLGVVGWKVGRVSWAQSRTPQGEAFGVDMLGFSRSSSTREEGEGGQETEQTLSIALSSRPEAFGDQELHQRFVTYLRRLVLLFASEMEGSGKTSYETQGGVMGKIDLTIDPTFGALT